jgi:hypothetical protein
MHSNAKAKPCTVLGAKKAFILIQSAASRPLRLLFGQRMGDINNNSKLSHLLRNSVDRFCCSSPPPTSCTKAWKDGSNNVGRTEFRGISFRADTLKYRLAGCCCLVVGTSLETIHTGPQLLPNRRRTVTGRANRHHSLLLVASKTALPV